MKIFLIVLLLSSAAAFGQSEIPAGTVLPVQLSTTLSSQKNKTGQKIIARVMQDVPLPSGKKIHAGAKVTGHVVAIQPAKAGQPTEVTLRFNTVNFQHRSIPINPSLRALASMMAVEDAQIPATGTDRGTPWAWTTKNLIGDEVAYGQGGPVARGNDTVGTALYEGVLVPARANSGSGCRGEVGGNTQAQALWVFSSDACGVYGIPDLEIKHAGRTPPLGEITLTTQAGKLEIRSGSGMLLRVVGSAQ